MISLRVCIECCRRSGYEQSEIGVVETSGLHVAVVGIVEEIALDGEGNPPVSR